MSPTVCPTNMICNGGLYPTAGQCEGLTAGGGHMDDGHDGMIDVEEEEEECTIYVDEYQETYQRP